MGAKLNRTIFETSRAAEYFSIRELQMQTGQPLKNFAEVVLKELGDNGLDSAETAGVPPELDISISGSDEFSISVKPIFVGRQHNILKTLIAK